MSDQFKKLCESRHPEYAENLEHWEFLCETYEGGRDWFEENLFKFVKEGEVEFEERKKRAYRYNHTKQVVDQVDKYLFKMDIARKKEDAPDAVKRYWERATLSNLSIDTLARRLSTKSSIYGRIWVVVDSNVEAGTVQTLKDEKTSGGQIYSYIVEPEDALDMSYDESGNLLWILLREYQRDDADPLNSSRETKTYYRLWTRDEWILFKEEKRRGKTVYDQIDRGVHGLGIVPVVSVDHVYSEEPYEASGLIDDIAYQDRAIANYLSNLDAIIQDQTFSQMAMPAQGMLPGEDGYDKLVTMSTKRVFLYNGEGGAAPFYLSPDPKQAELIIKSILSTISEIYHSVGLAGERTQSNSGGQNGEASGVAKSYDFERVNSLLTSKARALEMAERAILRIVCMYAGQESADVTELVTYPKQFDVRSVYDEFEIAAQLKLLSAPDELRREQMRTLIEKLFPAAPDKVLQTLESALKSWPPEEIAQPGLAAPKPADGKPSSGKDPLKEVSTQQTAKKLAT